MVLLFKDNKKTYLKNIRSLLFLFVLFFQFFSDIKLETKRNNSSKRFSRKRVNKFKKNIRKGKKKHFNKKGRINGKKMHGKNKKLKKSLQIIPPFPVESPVQELEKAEKAMSVSYFIEAGKEELKRIQNIQKPSLDKSMEDFMNKNSSNIIEALTFLATKHVYDKGLPKYIDFKLNVDDEAIKMDNVAKIQSKLSENGGLAMSEDLDKSSGDLLNVFNYLLSNIDPKEASNIGFIGKFRNNSNSAFNSAMNKVEELLKGSDVYTEEMTKEELYEKVYYIMISSRMQLIEFMRLIDKKTVANSELSNSFKLLIEYASMDTKGYDMENPNVIISNGISEASRLLLKSILSIYGVNVSINQYKGLIYGNSGWSTGKKLLVGLGAVGGMYLLAGAFNKEINKLDPENKSKFLTGIKKGSNFANKYGGEKALEGGRYVRDKAKAGYEKTKNFWNRKKIAAEKLAAEEQAKIAAEETQKYMAAIY